MQPDEVLNTAPAPAVLPAIIDGILVYADAPQGGAAAGAYAYLPLSASPVRTDSGRPSGQLMAAGEQAFLMLSAQWDVAPDRLERLRARLAPPADDTAPEDPAPVRLAFAPLDDVTADLLAAPSAILSQSRTSRMPPYSAMFSLAVTGDARAAAMAAMNGNPGALSVVFRGTLSAPLTIEGRFEGDFSRLEDTASLHAAMEEGRVRFETAMPAATSFFDQLCARALAVAQAMPAGPGRHVIDVRLDLAQPVAVSATGDIGSWFADAPAVLPSP